ncbi:TlpA family protein disulfide reductase [Actinoplanes sp. KI2]|uniref:TlpA family protein disulfide reductase n=1 Tax=Actinoplanes sp. KI2 TaxID=2983315 RepID=UPI0021D5EBC8|nr:TlpA disulfide reductase family protein [Actinoplanes sp. KI2]MCU7730286.1 TlpA family protein disulfide reductase [Actinoplanes sp. KI2]
MNKRLIRLGLVLLAVAGLGVTLAAGLRSTGGRRDIPQAQPRDEPAPALRGTTLTGSSFDLARQHGKVVLVNVWASWCDPCRQELPALAAAQRQWAAQGFTVAGIDMRDNVESARRMLTEAGAQDLTSVTDPQGAAAVAWGARGVPESFLVDRSGRVRWWVQGEVDAGWLRQQVPELLGS